MKKRGVKLFRRYFGAGRGSAWRKTRASAIRNARKTYKYVGFDHNFG